MPSWYDVKKNWDYNQGTYIYTDPIFPEVWISVHPLAQVDDSTYLNPRTRIHAHAIVHRHSYIGWDSVIESHAIVGRESMIYPQVRILDGEKIPPFTTVKHKA